MNSGRFWSIYILLAICQMLICNYFNFSPVITLTILPAMIVSIPPRIRVPWTMLIAFITGLAVDFLADGVPGLNACALVPVALLRDLVSKTILGGDGFGREDYLSVRTKGLPKVFAIVLVSSAVFFLVYVIADAAGNLAFLTGLCHFAASLAVSTVLSLAVVEALAPQRNS